LPDFRTYKLAYQLGAKILIDYDENGNRTSLTKRDRTTTIGFAYDKLNRLIVKDIPGGTANDVYFEYDEAGRPLWARFVSDTGSGVIYGYGIAKRLTSEASFGRSVGFDYDLAGNRTKVICEPRRLFRRLLRMTQAALA
jgi:YD repeat-containing protein